MNNNTTTANTFNLMDTIVINETYDNVTSHSIKLNLTVYEVFH